MIVSAMAPFRYLNLKKPFLDDTMTDSAKSTIPNKIISELFSQISGSVSKQIIPDISAIDNRIKGYEFQKYIPL